MLNFRGPNKEIIVSLKEISPDGRSEDIIRKSNYLKEAKEWRDFSSNSVALPSNKSDSTTLGMRYRGRTGKED